MEQYFSANYARTIEHADCFAWGPDHGATRFLWPNCVFDSTRRGKWSLRRVEYPYLRAELMISGETAYDSNGLVLVSRPGELHLTPVGGDLTVKSVPPDHRCRRIGIELKGILLSVPEFTVCRERRNILLRDPARMERMFRETASLLAAKRSGTEEEISALCYRILLHLSREISGTAKAELPENILSLLDVIHASPERNFTLRELAASACCSAATLNRIFREKLRCSPCEYVMNCKLEQASALLRTGEFSVKEIAEKFGFQNQFYFSRRFKAKYGVPPGAFRL